MSEILIGRPITWREIAEAGGKMRRRKEKHKSSTVQACLTAETGAENPSHATGVLLSLNHNPFKFRS